MTGRIGGSSNLLTASSSDFSYSLEGSTGFVRTLSSINDKLRNLKYKNVLVFQNKGENRR
jgi:hypothetical protein